MSGAWLDARVTLVCSNWQRAESRLPIVRRMVRRCVTLVRPMLAAAPRVDVRRPWLAKHNALRTAISFSIANNVVGDYLEFGVYQGGSFIRAYKRHSKEARAYAHRPGVRGSEFASYARQYFAFDSFEGLPQVPQNPLPLHWRGERAMSCSEEQFLANVRDAGLPASHIVTVPGLYDTTLVPGTYAKYGLRRAAIVHIDCDLYESAITVLEFVTPLVVDGTVLVFDDWFFYQGHPAKGEQGAFREWLERHPELVCSELCKFYPAAAFVVNHALPGDGREAGPARLDDAQSPPSGA